MSIVRKSNSAGPCINQGELIRETAKFYVFRSRFHDDGRERKAAKGNSPWAEYHIEPCSCCRDHPHTMYPNGYTD